MSRTWRGGSEGTKINNFITPGPKRERLTNISSANISQGLTQASFKFYPSRSTVNNLQYEITWCRCISHKQLSLRLTCLQKN